MKSRAVDQHLPHPLSVQPAAGIWMFSSCDAFCVPLFLDVLFRVLLSPCHFPFMKGKVISVDARHLCSAALSSAFCLFPSPSSRNKIKKIQMIYATPSMFGHDLGSSHLNRLHLDP